jgi:transcriptional regulator with XRE-family HTH domain
MPARLDDQIRRLLNKRRGDWPRIAAASGVSYSWLTKLAQGTLANPSYMRLERVLEQLNKGPGLW